LVTPPGGVVLDPVSPITIRLRILKVNPGGVGHGWIKRFTHHDPLEDTERMRAYKDDRGELGFTHHDPLEDTERPLR